MKTQTKKIILGLGLALCSSYSQAQGIDGIIVEKYYVANAADVANATANGATTALIAGQSITYRVYVDMAAGWKFSLLKGNSFHNLKITTTSTFYNDPNNGVVVGAQATSTLNVRKNTVMIDSWLTTGGTAVGKVGVIESQDADGSLGNAQSILANNPGGVYGAPINGVGAADGMINGTTVAPTVLGFGTATDLFDQTPGGSFLVNNGAMSALGGALGYGPNNTMLLGQFTTDGVFGFELNIQLINPSGTAVEYVASNPQAGETVFAGLTLAPNNPPTVSVTSPLNGANVITGSAVSITANAADIDGTVSSVQFFVDGTSIGTDNSSPYTASYTATVGSHTITAKATDNIGDFTTSSNVVINVANNQAPTVTISSPTTAVVADVVTFTSNASDVDGTISQVEFFVDNISIGIDNSTPFTKNWSAIVGSHSIKATATDNLGATSTSSIANINVVNNIPPTAAITLPLNGAAFTAPQLVTINASATDADGTVTQVEFFVNNASIGTDLTSPYTYTWTSVIGAANITVKSTDDKGAVTTSAILALTIADPNALPYSIGSIKQTCLQSAFCLPVAAATTYSVNDVIGYDITLNYDKTKVTPTGTITVNNALINPTYVDISNVIDAVNGIINISAYFNANAPASAEFNGVGNIFCVEFTKNGTFNSVDTAIFSISSLQESYFTGVSTKLVSNGKYTTYKDSLFNASLKFWANGSPISYNSANPNDYLITNVFGSNSSCVTNTLVAVQPALDGKFTYNILNGGNVSIQRDVLGTTSIQSVVNGFDALLGRKLLLNDPTFIPSVYQIVALDVNIDGYVSAGDVSQINQRAVLAIPEFKQAWNYSTSGVSNGQKSKDWLFIDSLRVINNPAYTISGTFPLNNLIGYSKSKVPSVPFCLPVTVTGLGTCPLITSEVYRGVMLGDVNGSFQSIANDGLIKRTTNNGDKVVFDLSKAIINGSSVDVPVYAVSATPVNALDFSLKYDNSNLAFNNVANYASTTEALSHLNSNDQTLRFTSNSLTPFNVSQSVVSIRFDMADGMINATDLNSLVGYLNGEEVNVEVINMNTVGINNLTSNSKEVSVYPNPTNGILNIVAIEDCTVQLLDVAGKQVLLQTSINANETQSINVDQFANGVYFLRIFNNNFITNKKVILNK